MKKNLLILSFIIITSTLVSQTFEEHLINQPITLPSATASGDMDNDGDIDIVTVSRAGEVIVYLNDGNESFSQVVYLQDHLGSYQTNKKVEVGDLNGDGLLDIVTASNYPSGIFYFKNLGNLNFQMVEIPTSWNGSEQRIVLVDADYDTDLDIITNNTGSIFVLVNEGNFQFTEYSFNVTNVCYDFRCLDINDDNKIDILTATKTDLAYYTQGSNYAFTKTSIESSGYVSLAVGDVNLDGDIDFLASKYSSNQMWLYLNDGDQTFTGSYLYAGIHLNLIDIDGDLKNDLFYKQDNDNWGSGERYRFSVILNENITDFNSSTDILVINDNLFEGGDTWDYSFNDFNNDGADDVIHTLSSNGRVQLYLSDLSGPHPLSNLSSVEVSNSSGDVKDISVADFDGDGDLDVVSCNSADCDIDWFKNTNFEFEKNRVGFVDYTPIKNEAIDLDEDGDIDIVACQQGANSDNDHWFMWYENDGNGSFTRHNIFTINNGGAIPRDVKVADMDNDNDLDIVGVGYSYTWIFFNDGNENFSTYQMPGLSSNSTYTAAIADIDSDNFQDIILTNNNGKISWCENNGDQTFNSPVELSSTSYPNVYSIEIADLDNDNDLDIVHTTTNSFVGLILLKNNGSMSFAESNVYFSDVVQPMVIKLEDINNDNFKDIVLGSNSGLLLYKNDQSGGFSKKSLLVNEQTYANIRTLEVDDFDDDGDIDIIFGSEGGDRIAWLELSSFENTIPWTGGSNNSWTTASNWLDSEVPTPTDNVIIPSNLSKYPTLSSATTINDLKLESDASLKGQQFLTVNGDISIERQITGYSSSSDGWHFLSSPVSNQTISGSDFVPSSGDDLYEWGESSGEWLNYNGGSFGDSQFEVGKGYLVAYNNTATKEFTGNFNTGTVTKNLTYNMGMGDGWNLLGNPYPSAIDWDLITRSGDVDNAAYIVNPLDGTYKSWVEGVGDITDGEIPVNQGFFVKANSGGQSVTMELANQVHSSNNFNKSTHALPEKTLKISLNAANSENNTYVRFKYDATEHFDSHSDAYKLFGFAVIPQVYTHLEETDYSINALNFSTEAISIPLGIYLNAEEDLSFNFTGLEGFNGNTRIELEDKTASKIINLREQSSYNFRGTTSDEADRFVLHFSQVTGLENIAAQDAQVYAFDGRVYIRLEEGANYSQMRLFDLSGRLLREQALSKQSLQSFDMSDLKGVYLVQLQGEDGSFTEKVTL